MKAEKQHKESCAELIQSKQGKSKLNFVDNRPQMVAQTKLINSVQMKDTQSQHLTPIIQLVKEGGSADDRAKAEEIETLIPKYNALKTQYDSEVEAKDSKRFKTKGLMDFIIQSIIALLTPDIEQLIDDDKVSILEFIKSFDKELSQESTALNTDINMMTDEGILALPEFENTQQNYDKVNNLRRSGSKTIDGGRVKNPKEQLQANTQWDKADDIIKAKIIEKGVNISSQELYELIYDTNIALNSSSTMPGKNRMNRDVSMIPLEDIPKQLYGYCVWLSAELKKLAGDRNKAVVLATQAAIKLNTIHPFADANGRTVKLITDYILITNRLAPQNGEPLEIYNANIYDTIEKKREFMSKQSKELLKKINLSYQEINT